MEEEEPEIEDRFSETRGRMSNIDKDAVIRFKNILKGIKEKKIRDIKCSILTYDKGDKRKCFKRGSHRLKSPKKR